MRLQHQRKLFLEKLADMDKVMSWEGEWTLLVVLVSLLLLLLFVVVVVVDVTRRRRRQWRDAGSTCVRIDCSWRNWQKWTR